jgi:hypothetical protein
VGGGCSAYGGEKRKACMSLLGEPNRKRPLGRPRRRWEDNILIHIVEIGWWCDLN